MAQYQPDKILVNGEPSDWGEAATFDYTQRDVLLYAVGIGIRDLRYVYEQHDQFAVFPTFPIRWGGAGSPPTAEGLPPSPGPLNIDAERYLEQLKPLPVEGQAGVESRVVGIHPKGRGNGLVEYESVVRDAEGDVCFKMVNGSFRRGVEELGDIEPFEGAGTTYSEKLPVPDRGPDLELSAHIPDNQAHIYRLSGDYNPLHIEPEAAKFGGFDEPILHGLCTFGHCGQLLVGALCDGDASRFRKIRVRFASPVFLGDTLELRAWYDGPGRVLFEARVEDTVVVSNAYFEFDP